MGAIAKCLQSFATSYSACDNPSGLGAAQAQALFDSVNEACNSGQVTCDVYSGQSDLGSITTVTSRVEGVNGTVEGELTFEYDADGNFETIRGFFVQPNRSGGITRQGFSVHVDPPDPSNNKDPSRLVGAHPPVSPTAPYVPSEGLARNVARSVFQGLVRASAGYVLDVWTGGSRRSGQCEAFTGPGAQPVAFQRSGTDGGFRLPGLIGPEDAIGFCLCQGGEDGRGLANAMGYSCPRSGAYAERLKCMIAATDDLDNTMQPPPGHCVGFAIDDNPSRSIAGMCSSVIQCPAGSALSGGLVDGDLRCGCARLGSTGGRLNECRTVDCTGEATNSTCCTVPAARMRTPRGTAGLVRPISTPMRINLPATFGPQTPTPLNRPTR